jgi:hypothetical protein
MTGIGGTGAMFAAHWGLTQVALPFLSFLRCETWRVKRLLKGGLARLGAFNWRLECGLRPDWMGKSMRALSIIDHDLQSQ